MLLIYIIDDNDYNTSLGDDVIVLNNDPDHEDSLECLLSLVDDFQPIFSIHNVKQIQHFFSKSDLTH